MSSIRKRCSLCVFLVMLSLSGFAKLGRSTLACDGCRPMSLQEGPGVGLSLSPGHGSASVEFVNGTIVDFDIVEGTEAYVEAMQSWPDARLEWSSLPETTILESMLTHLGLRKAATPQPQLPQSLTPIADMVQALWRNVNASTHLEHNRVRMSVPDSVMRNGRTQDQLAAILAKVGLKSLRHWPQCKHSLLSLYNLEDCYDDATIEECAAYHERPIRSVLSIHLDKRSMSLQEMTREDGVFYLGTGATTWRENSTNLADKIRQYTDHDIDLISLTGPEAYLLHDTIKEVFHQNAKVMPEDYIRSTDEQTYAASRGAARLARMGMCNDWESCVQSNHCPVSVHCKWTFFEWEGSVQQEL